MGAKNGILFKNAEALQEAGNVQIVALDKTGTITKGEPSVTDLIASAGVDEDTLLQKAYALEKKSEHPLAKAVTERATVTATADNSNSPSYDEITDFRALPGNGLTGVLAGCRLYGGNESFIKSKIIPAFLKV